MKQLFLTVLFLLTTCLVSGQNEQYSREFYKSGELKQEGYTENEMKTAYWKFYYSNGQMMKEGHYRNDLPVKYWFFYRMDGTKIMEGHFDRGMKSKWWIFYNAEGKVLMKCEYLNNRQHGYCLYFREDEIVRAEQYVEGKKKAEWTDLESFKKDHRAW